MFPSTAILLRLLTALVHSLFAGEAISFSLSSLPSASVERAAIQWQVHACGGRASVREYTERVTGVKETRILPCTDLAREKG